MATTPNYSLSIYNSSDTDVRFLDFRVAIAGTQTTSNFYVIDGALKEHSDAINTLKNSPQAYIVKANFASGIYNASVSGFTGYKANQLIILSLNQTNTGSVSININNSSNKNVMLYSDAGTLRNAIAGEFVENSAVLCYYDGTQFVAVGVPKGSAIYVDGEQRDILQISSSGAIESSGKQAGQPNGIATLDSDGKVEQVAKIADGAASGEAVYSGNAIKIPYVSENRIASITAYGENAQGGTTEAPVALTGVDSVHVCGRNLLQMPYSQVSETKNGLNIAVNADGTITVSGTATAETYLNLKPIPASLYRLMGVTGIVPAYDYPVTKNGFTFFDLTIQPHVEFASVYIVIAKGSIVNRTYRPYIIKSAEPLPYEPYQGSVTTLPIPRPLHEVGDVRDVCQTRVKSVYDKHIVLSSADGFSFSSNAGNGYARFYKAYNSAKLSPIASDWLPGYAKTAYDATNEGVYSADSDAGAISIVLSIKRLTAAGATSGDTSTYLTAASAIFAATPLTVYYQSTDYNGTNGLDVCLTEYQTDFMELDGTETWSQGTGENAGYLESSILRNANESHLAVSSIASFKYQYGGNGVFVTAGVKVIFGAAIGSAYTVDTWKAYLAAQKAAGTPVQVAYHLATPEVYATDPVDFDNTAGPLTVVTGGQVEVKMTDFVTDRTPAFLNKLDKTGDGSDVTATFTEATEDADIASSDKLSILFGKILKRFSTITSKFTTVEGDISDIVDGTTTVANATTAATADKVKNKLSLLSGGGQDTIIYDGSTAIAAAMNSSFIGAEPAFIKNSAFNKNFGSSAGTVCQGNDGRLSDARRSSNISMSLSGTNLSISYS